MRKALPLTSFLLFAAASRAGAVSALTLDRSIVEARMLAVVDSNADRENTLRDILERAGCAAPRLAEQPVKHQKIPNLICTMKGMSERTIVVGAHSDHVKEGLGAVDNWSGAALLASLYQSLAQTPRNHTFVFVAFTAEEEGEVGSRFYVKSLAKQELSSISAMVNLDSLGTASTKVATFNADQLLLSALATVANTLRVPLSAVNFDKVGVSDSGSFSSQRIRIIDLHSLTQNTFSILHSNKDRLSAIDMNAYYDSYRLIAAYLAYLDELLDAPTPVVP